MTFRLTAASVLVLLSSLQGCGSADDIVAPPEDGAGGEAGDGDGDERSEYVPRGESCEFGDDEDKCEGDDTLACTPIPGVAEEACDNISDCSRGELCLELGDEGQFCRVIHGECLEPFVEDDGERFGEPCEGHDDCAGFCVEVNDEQETFECEENCRMGATSGCGFDDMQEAGVACAFFAANLKGSGLEQGTGDFGVCAHLCDCTEECPGDQKCIADPQTGYAGVCTGGEEKNELTPCPTSGMGGTQN